MARVGMATDRAHGLTAQYAVAWLDSIYGDREEWMQAFDALTQYLESAESDEDITGDMAWRTILAYAKAYVERESK